MKNLLDEVNIDEVVLYRIGLKSEYPEIGENTHMLICGVPEKEIVLFGAAVFKDNGKSKYDFQLGVRVAMVRAIRQSETNKLSRGVLRSLPLSMEYYVHIVALRFLQSLDWINRVSEIQPPTRLNFVLIKE